MNLAIVGSRSLAGNKQAEAVVYRVLDVYRPNVLITGDAVGIDEMAARAAQELGITTRVLRPQNRHWRPDGFRKRNLRIVQACDLLVCIADKNSKTYGSGWTRDRARDVGKPTEEFAIDT